MKIKKNIVIMYLIGLLQGMVFYSAVSTLYRQAVGVTVFQITIIESISLALALAFELPWGILAEKIGYKRTMIICCMLYFLSKIVFWKANGFGMFLLERIMLSIVMAGLSGVDISVLYLSCEKERVHKVFSIYDSLQTAGLLIAAGIYNVFLCEDYRAAGLATVISYGIAAVLACFLKEVKSTEPKEEPPMKEFVVILKDTLKRKELLLFLVGIALFSECHQTITVFLNQLQYIRSGMSDRMIGIVYVIVTIIGLLGAKSASFTKTLGKKKTGILLFSTAIGACLALMLTVNPILSVVAILLLRLAYSLLVPLSQTIENQMVTHKNRATALSIHSLIMDGVAIFTNLIYGKVSDCYLPAAFAIGMGFCIIGLLLFVYSTNKMVREG
ncbi:MFS transporter [Anaerosporobacter faecicola]|uniref:MFS transporter n=1 Tax=Anaerosporobacter faecicola TaxID=2718714 RepID=UPI00143989A0|nr:MFS transporter [Anaerosporobacter faecicola]